MELLREENCLCSTINSLNSITKCLLQNDKLYASSRHLQSLMTNNNPEEMLVSFCMLLVL